jgi:hypothetical protein
MIPNSGRAPAAGAKTSAQRIATAKRFTRTFYPSFTSFAAPVRGTLRACIFPRNSS